VETSGTTLSLKGSGSAIMMAVPSESGKIKGEANFEQSAGGAALASVNVPSGMTYTIPVSKRLHALAVTKPEGAALGTRR
jgi:hypothetical protein